VWLCTAESRKPILRYPLAFSAVEGHTGLRPERANVPLTRGNAARRLLRILKYQSWSNFETGRSIGRPSGYVGDIRSRRVRELVDAGPTLAPPLSPRFMGLGCPLLSLGKGFDGHEAQPVAGGLVAVDDSTECELAYLMVVSHPAGETVAHLIDKLARSVPPHPFRGGHWLRVGVTNVTYVRNASLDPTEQPRRTDGGQADDEAGVFKNPPSYPPRPTMPTRLPPLRLCCSPTCC
jgi:hypothetical protein